MADFVHNIRWFAAVIGTVLIIKNQAHHDVPAPAGAPAGGGGAF